MASSVACAGGGGIIPPESTGRVDVQGIVRSGADGSPVQGVLIELDPGDRSTMTDASGRYAFTDLEANASYLLKATAENFASVSSMIELGDSGGAVIANLTLPPFSRIETPIGGLRIWANAIDGFALDDPSITFQLEIENRGSQALTEIAIHDSLGERADGYRLALDDFVVNQQAFPSARIELGPDGRSFEVRIDELPPMTTIVELLHFTIPTPPAAGVYCNIVRGTATANGGDAIGHEDSSCLAGGI